VASLSNLLLSHPLLDINTESKIKRRTALHHASNNNHVAVVKLLLAHPAISVNHVTSDGWTPLALACKNGHVAVVKLLLAHPAISVNGHVADVKLQLQQDPRGGVNLFLGQADSRTPLWWAACRGHVAVIEWLIASGRDLGDLLRTGEVSGEDFSAEGIARENGFALVATLLENLVANPVMTRQQVRGRLGVLDGMVAEVFAMIVFVCEGLLRGNSTEVGDMMRMVAAGGATRFFEIASKLPMELQMILCHRVFGSMKQYILVKDSEAAFSALAEILLELSKSK